MNTFNDKYLTMDRNAPITSKLLELLIIDCQYFRENLINIKKVCLTWFCSEQSDGLLSNLNSDLLYLKQFINQLKSMKFKIDRCERRGHLFIENELKENNNDKLIRCLACDYQNFKKGVFDAFSKR